MANEPADIDAWANATVRRILGGRWGWFGPPADMVDPLAKALATERAEADEARAALAEVVADVKRRAKDATAAAEALSQRGLGSATTAWVAAQTLDNLLTDLEAGPSGTALTTLLATAREEGRRAGLEEAAELIDNDDTFDPWPAVHRTVNVREWGHARVASLQSVLDAVLADGARAIRTHLTPTPRAIGTDGDHG